MKKVTGEQVRQKFLDYFKSKNHMVEQGHSLIPHDDPTLLWINSGVAALKKYFDGSVKPASNRIVNAQKAIRTNDIENVGKTARHHTFFEMLGNFSIGDYFKKEAIEYAWEFLTSNEWMGLDKDKMYISVHTDDDEAYSIWMNQIGVPQERILRTEDNFWQIGEGPSGPNSEIFYDRGSIYDPKGLGEKLFFDEIDNDRYIEVWNIVFSQYDAKEGVDRKDYKELPQKNIDTGMGLERLVSIIQEGETNFDTDLFLPIIRKTETFAKVGYKDNKTAFRVIADHVRTITFALGDGAIFSNEGRGYVLRRIIRRAIRFGIQIGIEKSFMYELVDTVIEIMKSFYPELVDKSELIKKLVKIEEERFHLTLHDGEKLLNNLLTKHDLISGENAFKLYDTYGFPLEMTVEIASEKGITVDVEGFNENMKRQKQMSRAARVDVESMTTQHEDLLNFTGTSVFVGYTQTKANAKVIGLFEEGNRVTTICNKGQVVFDLTPFYAESGGQIADSGTVSSNLVSGRILNVQKAPHNQNLHTIEIDTGELSEGDTVTLEINQEKRTFIRRNHSSVHLLQKALKEIVGNHIQQAGSYVSHEYSRFDFSHYEKIDADMMNKIERRVNEMVFENNDVITEIMSLEEAKVSGAIALFDEKYTDEVRVVTMGESKELCGGTHVSQTSEIGVYKIVSEESVGSGVRRIVAKTSKGAYEEFKNHENHLETIAQMVRANSVSKIDEKLVQMRAENEQLQQQVNESNQIIVNAKAESLLGKVTSNDTLVFKSTLDGKLGKLLVETLRSQLPKALVFGAFVNSEKVTFICAASQNWVQEGFKAGDLVKEAAKLTNGGGGGRPDFAQAGGKDVSKVDLVIDNINKKLSN